MNPRNRIKKLIKGAGAILGTAPNLLEIDLEKASVLVYMLGI